MPPSEVHLLHNNLIVGALLFGIGVIGILARRNVIVMFLSAEMMLQGISLSLVAWSRFHNDWGGQMLVVFVITVAACEAAIALALVLMLFRRRGVLDIAAWERMREQNLPPHVDREVPEETADQPLWPSLTPAGVQPELDEDSLTHRPHV